MGEQLSKTAATDTNETELAELAAKLKKTISERDLLIREYKNVKDHSTKMEVELNATKQSLLTKTQDSQTLAAEIEKLKANITKLEEPSTNTVCENGSAEKDELIKKCESDIVQQ